MATVAKKVTKPAIERTATNERTPTKARMYLLDVPGNYCDVLLCSRQQATAVAEFIEEISGIHVEVRTVTMVVDIETVELEAFVSSKF